MHKKKGKVIVSYVEQNKLETMYMMTAYGRKPVEFVWGKGTRLYDSKGKEYLDFLAGLGAVCLGHADPAVSAAIAAQAQKLIQVSNYYYIEGRGELARDLSNLLNEESKDAKKGRSARASKEEPWKLFFANSGAEANEGALKLARKYGKLHLNGAGTVLSAQRSFHGRTLATTAATGQEAKQESFAPMPAGFVQFNPCNIEELKALIRELRMTAEETGQADHAPVAVLLECVQGEDGVWPLSAEQLQAIRTLTAEEGMLLILDEVQTGFYRTGKPFAFMHACIRPDVVTMAKGIANGFPCAALAATGSAAEVFVPGEHGSTFGGNSLAVAAAQATLQELKKRDLGTQARELGAFFKEQLSYLPQVVDVRGRGLMLGLTLDGAQAQEVAEAALKRGVLINAIGDSILRFLPPLTITKEEVESLIVLLRELLETA